MTGFFPDCHTHTRQSKDSQVSMRDYCERALALGVTHLAFTDHIDLDPADFSFGFYDFARARGEFEVVRAEFGGRIELAFGVEISCQTSLLEDARRAIAGRPYDIVIGSVHILDGLGGDISSREVTPKMFERWGAEKIYEKYLAEVEGSVECGLFDVIGHIGIPKRHGLPYMGEFDISRFEDRLERIARKIARSGVALEVNTSGLWQPPGETYPAAAFVRRYLAAGGERITVGSDAHALENVGRCVPEALEMLRGLGVKEITVYRNREACKQGI
jgi:histidinol-phosphatase (PHP family)